MTAAATRLVAVNVTSDYIRWGLPLSNSENTLALAIHDAFPEAWYVITTDTAAILVMPPGEQRKVTLPAEAARFGRDYRDSKPVQPFTFTLEVPA